MKIMLNIASSMSDVLNLIIGRDFTDPAPQALDLYPQSNNPQILTLGERYMGEQ